MYVIFHVKSHVTKHVFWGLLILKSQHPMFAWFMSIFHDHRLIFHQSRCNSVAYESTLVPKLKSCGLYVLCMYYYKTGVGFLKQFPNLIFNFGSLCAMRGRSHQFESYSKVVMHAATWCRAHLRWRTTDTRRLNP